jgi:hypothetical protein
MGHCYGLGNMEGIGIDLVQMSYISEYRGMDADRKEVYAAGMYFY